MAADRLDPQMRLAMRRKAEIAAAHNLTSEGTGTAITEARRQYDLGRQWWNADAPELAQVIDDQLPGPHGPIPVRRYYPRAGSSLPGIIFFHGGGNVVGNLQTHDKVTRLIAQQSGCAVIAVDYRLAPENKFPKPLDDCLAAVEYSLANATAWQLNPEKIAVAGDSAGASWALAAVLADRDHGRHALKSAGLIYGAYFRQLDSPSYGKFGGPEFDLPIADLAIYRDMLLADHADADDPRLCLGAADLSGLPPVHVFAAGLDPLLDESVQLAHRLRTVGNHGDFIIYRGMVHAFIHYSRMVDQAWYLIDDLSAAITRDFCT
jgi:acetyl esterase